MIARVVLAALLIASTAQAAILRLEWGPPLVGVPEGYVMYRQVGGAGPFDVLATIPAPTLTYTDTTVPVGIVCYYCTAYNAGGESVPSNTACFSHLEAPTGPPVALRLVP